MRAPLSVVLPTLNAAGALPGALEALMEGVPEGLIRELIVADGGSTDATCAIADAAGARIVRSEPGRAAQMIAGAEAAGGRWLLFLHADTMLSPGWTRAVGDHLARSEDRAATFTLRFRSSAREARWLEGRVKLRVRLLGLAYGDQGLLISRRLYDRLGGFAPLPFLEDVDIVRRIGKARLDVLPAEAVTSAAKFERDGWRKRAWSNAWIVARYTLGASPESLKRDYR